MANKEHLPYDFDLLYDIKTMSELKQQINDAMALLYTVNYHREFLEKNGVALPYNTLQTLLTERENNVG